ncbi:MAG TPA: AAA family ATPase [Mycobacteriales bacterium]
MAAGELMILTGAPGSGKTAVAPGLRAALPGVVVLDLDQFLDAGGRLAGLDLHEQSAAGRWPAYNDLCLSLVAAVLAAGHDVLLLCPLTPDEVGRTAAALGIVRWMVLDCSDATRRRRLRTRPGEPTDADAAAADAAELRALGLPVLHNDGISIDAAVGLITASWRGQTSG